MTTTRPHTNRDDVSELERLRKEWERARAHPIEHYGEADHPERGTIACVTLHDAEQIVAALTTALTAKDEEIARLRVAITKLYRSPLLDESGYHERGEDIPEDVWDACEVIRQVLTPRPTEGGDR